MARMPIPHQPEGLSRPGQAARAHRWGLFGDVPAYPQVRGRLHTCYSPIRHAPEPKPGRIRLACVKPAASVHPEPGSNSPLDKSAPGCHGLAALRPSMSSTRVLRTTARSSARLSHRIASKIARPSPPPQPCPSRSNASAKVDLPYVSTKSIPNTNHDTHRGNVYNSLCT